MSWSRKEVVLLTGFVEWLEAEGFRLVRPTDPEVDVGDLVENSEDLTETGEREAKGLAVDYLESLEVELGSDEDADDE